MKEKIKAVSLQTITQEADIPLNVTIELLTRCNLKCTHCYIPERVSEGLAEEVVARLLRELKELGALYLNLTGGEIFLRKNSMGIIRDARSLGFSVNLLSNATLINEDIVKELADLHISSFGTTIFSLNQEVHEAITGVNGSLRKALENVALLKKHGIAVEIKTPILKPNRHEFREVGKFCAKNGFDFNPCPTISSKMNGDTSVRDLRIDDDGMDDAIDLILAGSSPEAEALLDKVRRDESICPSLKNTLFIDASGEVFPCISFRHKLGDVFSSDLKTIWQNSPGRKYLLSLKKRDLQKCSTCGLKEKCVHCPGHALLEDGSPLACSSDSKRTAESEYRVMRKGGTPGKGARFNTRADRCL